MTWNGRSWAAPVALPRFEDYVALSCPAPGSCLALSANGGTLRLVNGRWRSGGTYDPRVAGPAYGRPAASLSCTAANACVAVNGAGDEVTLGAGGWNRPVTIDRAALTGVTCPEPGSCVAVDGEGDVLVSTAGRFGKPLRVTPDALQSVACATPAFCAVADLDGTVRVGSSTHLGPPHSLGGAPGQPVAVACPSNGVCVAAGPENAISVFSDNRWHVVTPPADKDLASMETQSVSCPIGWQDFCAVANGLADVSVGGAPFT